MDTYALIENFTNSFQQPVHSIRTFVRFCIDEIETAKGVRLVKIPKVTLTKNKDHTETLGHNDVMNHEIVVFTKDRLPADVCRTLAHELVHSVQMQAGELNEQSGDDGSPQENEANSLAGIILRKWGRMHPEIYRKENPVEEQTKPKTTDRKFECLMLDIPAKNWQSVQKLIDEKDIRQGLDFGRCMEPHVTVKYGLHPGTDLQKIKEYISSKYPEGISIQLIGLSCFNNQDFDVLKFDVESPQLREINAWICENFAFTDKFKGYKIHMTVAYLKPGTGGKYTKRIKEPKTVVSNHFTYSYPSGEEEHFVVEPVREDSNRAYFKQLDLVLRSQQ